MNEHQPGYSLHFHRSISDNGSDNGSGAKSIDFLQHYPAQDLSAYKLPNDDPFFTGRQTEVAEAIEQLLYSSKENNAPKFYAITGQSGIGKSTLAVYAAQRLKRYFRDVQLYVNLGGVDEQPVNLSWVLKAWLSHLNIEAKLNDERELLEILQSAIVGKRVLFLLDDVRDAAQIRALIPANISCVVIITSRAPLPELSQTIAVSVAELSESESFHLLQKRAGAEIMQTEPETVQRIIQGCAGIPLALSLAAGGLKYSAGSVQGWGQQFTEELQRLLVAQQTHPQIRTSFWLNYQQLNSTAAQLLRLLGLLPKFDFTASLAAALLQTELPIAQDAIQQLVRMQFIKPIAADYYQLRHEQIRSLARGLLARGESTEQRQSARLRLSGWYLKTAMLAGAALEPLYAIEPALNPAPHSSPNVTALALDWFNGERSALLAAMSWAQASEPLTVCDLAMTMAPFLDRQQDWTTWEQTHQQALTAARQVDDRPRVAALLNSLGNLALRQQRWQQAENHYQQSYDLSRNLTNPAATAQTLANLGLLYLTTGDPPKAAELWRACLELLSPAAPEFQAMERWMQQIDPQLLAPAEPEPEPTGSFLRTIGGLIKKLLD